MFSILVKAATRPKVFRILVKAPPSLKSVINLGEMLLPNPKCYVFWLKRLLVSKVFSILVKAATKPKVFRILVKAPPSLKDVLYLGECCYQAQSVPYFGESPS